MPKDDFLAGYHDLLGNEELAGLSDNNLLSLLDEATLGSPRHRQLEKEWKRRTSVGYKPNGTANGTAQPSNRKDEPKRRWFSEPIGIVGLGVLVVAIGAFVTHLLKSHFGLNP